MITMSTITERFMHYKATLQRPGVKLLSQFASMAIMLAFLIWIIFGFFGSVAPLSYFAGIWTGWLVFGVALGLVRLAQGLWRRTLTSSSGAGSFVGSAVAVLVWSVSSTNSVLQGISSVHLASNAGQIMAITFGVLFGSVLQLAAFDLMRSFLDLLYYGISMFFHRPTIVSEGQS